MLMIDQRVLLRKAGLAGVLERLCQSLELTDPEYRQARERYEGVGTWLVAGDNAVLRNLSIYLQGSAATRTTVKPINRNEHDVDLIAHIRHLGTWIQPTVVKKAIGDRLQANGHYAPLLKEMPRCWRLSYANEFHLDITPSIPNPACRFGGELVPDKAVRMWTASNPKGYRALFDRRASLTPRFSRIEGVEKGVQADIERYPASGGLKGILRRTVQLTKRHRDRYFEDLDSSLAPISVIITTLASRSYEYCVGRSVYNSEFDVLCDVIRHMPVFIEASSERGKRQWFIWNETTAGENFAEKWNRDPRRADAFWTWHAQALSDLENLAGLEGIDRVAKSLSQSFGPEPANKALGELESDISSARETGRLAVAPAIGLSLGSAARSTSVRANTIFGAE